MQDYVTEPVVKVSRISKVFHAGNSDVMVLNDISFDIYHGEMVALMGPAGSGKSSLMAILSLFDVPTSGQYWLGGKSIHALSRVRQIQVRTTKLGLVLQNTRLTPRFSVAENVALPLAYARMNAWERAEKTREALTAVGLAAKANHRLHDLAAGEKARVVIARALVNKPQVLLVEEPTAALDAATGAEILALLHTLNRMHGLTIVVATDNPQIGQRMDRVIGLYDGHLCHNILEAHYAPATMDDLCLPASKVPA